MFLEVGGRSEVLDASGVLFLLPMILLAIVDSERLVPQVAYHKMR